MKFIKYAFAAVTILGAAVTHAGTFARESDSYCNDLGDTAQRAAKFRDEGHAFSVARARDGWKPNRYLVDFDQSADRIQVSRLVYASKLTPDQARKWAINLCHSGK